MVLTSEFLLFILSLELIISLSLPYYPRHNEVLNCSHFAIVLSDSNSNPNLGQFSRTSSPRKESQCIRQSYTWLCQPEWRVRGCIRLYRAAANLYSTTGGNGGTVTTVSTLPQFTAAVNEKNTAPLIVVVKGIITGAVNVRIGSNKSVIGLPGSGMSTYVQTRTPLPPAGVDVSYNIWTDSIAIQVLRALGCIFAGRRMSSFETLSPLWFLLQ